MAASRKFKQLLWYLGITQKEIAEAVGYSYRHFVKLVSQKRINLPLAREINYFLSSKSGLKIDIMSIFKEDATKKNPENQV